MNFENLTTQQNEKAIGCRTPEELLKLANAQLQSISGGWDIASECTDHFPNAH